MTDDSKNVSDIKKSHFPVMTTNELKSFNSCSQRTGANTHRTAWRVEMMKAGGG